jgi:hypothetical protein
MGNTKALKDLTVLYKVLGQMGALDRAPLDTILMIIALLPNS